MQINTNNCEAFFLDYYEGNLSEGQVAELFAFLKANPELRDVFESFSEISVDAESTAVPDFSFLKKEPVADLHEQAEVWMVEMVEGTISDADRVALENYLNEHPSKRADLAAFENTVLRADAEETFGDLSQLKKDVAVTPENFEHFAVALMEGTISEQEKSLLESFVLTHPEFEVELDAFRNAVQQADESVVFEGKESLKRTALVVTKENIEALLVDRIEGQLSRHDEQAVDAFVAAHPEYKQELELFAKTKLVVDASEVFEAKQQLKRGAPLVNESNFEHYAISAAEGLLNSEELKAFNAFAATQPKYSSAAKLYAATRVQADMTVVYDDKAGLKRKEKGAIIWWSVSMRYAAAAVLVIVLGIYLWSKIGNDEQNLLEYANGDKKETPAPANNDVAPVPNELPENSNDQYANNDASSNEVVRPVTNNTVQPGTEVTPVPVRMVDEGFRPSSIVATNLRSKGANDAVNYSDALYAMYDQNAEPNTQPVATNSDYITPGQLAMRWMKNKIDGPDAVLSTDIDQDGQPLPRDPNVDGLDLTQSAVNRVGQSAAKGNIAMQQRKDGTYLKLWSYEVRVRK